MAPPGAPPPLSAWAQRRRNYCHTATLLGLSVGGYLIVKHMVGALQHHLLPPLLGTPLPTGEALTAAAEVSGLSLVTLERYLAFATLIEMTSNLETLWFRQRERTLPYWSPRICQRLADAVFLRPLLNNVLVTVLLTSLLVIVAGYGGQWLRVLNAALFVFLSLVDLPRLFRLQQCMFSLTAFAFASSPVRSLQLILGGVYFYSGLSKLIMPVFYTDWADGVCAPLKALMDFVTLRVCGLSAYPRLVRGLFFAVVGLAMAGETAMGLALLDSALLGRWTSPVWSHLLIGGVMSVGLHAYIIVFIIALPAQKEPGILNWNVLCSVVAIITTQLLLVAPAAHGLSADSTQWTATLFGLASDGLFQRRTLEVLYHALIVFAFTLYPASMYFGRAFAFEFTFSYFNGAMFGSAYGVFPRNSTARTSFPTAVRDRTLRRFEIAADASLKPLGFGETVYGSERFNPPTTSSSSSSPSHTLSVDSSSSSSSVAPVTNAEPLDRFSDLMTGSWWESGSAVGECTGLDSYRELLDLWSRRGISLPLLCRQMGLLSALEAQGDVATDLETAARRTLLQQTFALDCDWLCATHTSDIADPYRAASSCYLPAHFFGFLARTALLKKRRWDTHNKPPVVYVRTGHEVWFGPWITQELIPY